jgi:hypothetical protein
MIQDNIIDLAAIVFLFPIFILRAFHYLYDRVLFRDHNAVVAVDSFAREFRYARIKSHA